ncbi:MAG: DUF4352 domain-containing protein [Actinomycetales bacterium]|nr:DUF4352 domain-containing protein [Actinomycetales bacterium]
MTRGGRCLGWCVAALALTGSSMIAVALAAGTAPIPGTTSGYLPPVPAGSDTGSGAPAPAPASDGPALAAGRFSATALALAVPSAAVRPATTVRDGDVEFTVTRVATRGRRLGDVTTEGRFLVVDLLVRNRAADPTVVPLGFQVLVDDGGAVHGPSVEATDEVQAARRIRRPLEPGAEHRRALVFEVQRDRVPAWLELHGRSLSPGIAVDLTGPDPADQTAPTTTDPATRGTADPAGRDMA